MMTAAWHRVVHMRKLCEFATSGDDAEELPLIVDVVWYIICQRFRLLCTAVIWRRCWHTVHVRCTSNAANLHTSLLPADHLRLFNDARRSCSSVRMLADEHFLT